MLKEERSFEELLSEAIDEALGALGDNVKLVVYYYLERNLGIEKRTIPKDMRSFQKELRRMFSDGAKVIEELIIKKLYDKIGVKAEEDEEFVNRVERARSIFEKRQSLRLKG